MTKQQKQKKITIDQVTNAKRITVQPIMDDNLLFILIYDGKDAAEPVLRMQMNYEQAMKLWAALGDAIDMKAMFIERLIGHTVEQVD